MSDRDQTIKGLRELAKAAEKNPDLPLRDFHSTAIHTDDIAEADRQLAAIDEFMRGRGFDVDDRENAHERRVSVRVYGLRADWYHHRPRPVVEASSNGHVKETGHAVA